ncbi:MULTISPECIES: homoserine dehydrogenase [Auritidibacter]|uniref:Homoserine dehydrogenase n=1 Tax=Auritidibacter ignavus TaxID=678932 RepID=A0AAJ6DCP1_9MICC|nr:MULTISPECIES: homoserine dehydrogenase [Auritidibacter]PXA81318.1 homoserine dehydrogenase [Auritidibacter sp. NML120779]AXR73223.1 homoserine dehydrogenase [Auritidibacter sp. NML130574]NIH71019.1 homoserine dehydrogenase [Auritidibacter ignavus]PXA77502.1 homoserine dehydrogenase [Auritidibacter sp. NML100628]PXA81978.1 homoserine dehydrogenase [Auritidibacter sp. NML120636]
MTGKPAVQELKVALLGGGTVGSQVARILVEDSELMTERVGVSLRLTGVAVRNPEAERDYQLPAECYTTDAKSLVRDADIVIELMGGIAPARDLILTAFDSGASVVTGNKALLATHGHELYQAAADAGVQLSFEASVAGAIPILRPVRDSLSGDRITRIMGIVNGTTNYIMDQMDSTGANFYDALAEAQRLGYAEADPTADVGGADAAAKAAVLAHLAFSTPFTLEQVYCQGMTNITDRDHQMAAEAGYVIKMLAIIELVQTADDQEPGVVLRVHPTLLPRVHPLATVRGAYNAVFVEAENAGELMFYGPGAGGAPTASAVMGDTVSIARRILRGGPGRPHTTTGRLKALGVGDSITRYMVVLRTADVPGVLSQVAGVFAERGLSIKSMNQSPDEEAAAVGKQRALLRFITHQARESDLSQTVSAVEELDVVDAVLATMRVEGD